MVGLPDIVHVQRRVEREFLVGVDIDHGPLAERALQPDTNRTVNVLADGWRGFIVIVLVIVVVVARVVIVVAADEYSNVDLVVLLVHDELAHPTVVAAQCDAKLEFADVSFPESERMA